MNLMKMYNSSPIFLQNVFTSLEGLSLRTKRYGKFYHQYLKIFRSRDYSRGKEIDELQNQMFLDYLQNAVNYSPFYKSFYQDIDLCGIKSIGDISKLPILSKEIVRENIEKLYSTKKEKFSLMSTSGTSGKTINIKVSNKDLQIRMAYLDVFKEKHGFKNLKMKKATFNSSKIVPPESKKKVFSRYNIFMKQRFFSGYHCSGDNLFYYVKELNRFKPKAIDGLPSVIYKLAKYIVDNQIKLTFSPIAVFPTAETFLPHYRETIEKAFHCKAYNQYASTEASPFIVECSQGKMHYRKDTGIIEVKDDGDMLVTCFFSTATPLIRYAIGDALEGISNEKCLCADSSPIVGGIRGRSTDFLLTYNGDKLSTLFLSLVSRDFDNSIKQMQFVQENKETVIVYLEVDDKYKPFMSDIIIGKLKYSMGPQMNISVIVVDKIKNPGLKHQLVINKLLSSENKDGKQS